MSLENVPRCQHVKVNGTQCGSPALRRKRHCYFHHRMLDAKKRFAAESCIKPRPLFSMGLLEDANSVQVALMQVLTLLGSGQMDPKIAGLMLYGLQTASANLRHVKFEAEKPTDVVIDRDTVDQTCINGPQWFARDFADAVEAAETEQEVETEQDEQDGVAAASAEEAQAEAGQDQAGAETAGAAKNATGKVRADKRKRPERAGPEQAPEWVRQVMRGLVPEWSEAGAQNKVEAG